MMEKADIIQWSGFSESRFLERALEREAWGNYNGFPNLGKRLIEEVQYKIKEISENLNLYQIREGDERVVPLESGFILIYRKEYYSTEDGKKLCLLIIDVRKSY